MTRRMIGLGLLALGFAAGLAFSAALRWPSPAQAIPQVGVPQEQLAEFYREHQADLYTLYYDFDRDGDVDIARGVGGPIRIIENRTVTHDAAGSPAR